MPKINALKKTRIKNEDFLPPLIPSNMDYRYHYGYKTDTLPEFYVFYNRTDPYPDIKTLRLSDAYIKEQEKPQLELTVDVYNIDDPHPDKPLTGE